MLEREALTDRAEARQEYLCAFTRGLMAIFGTVGLVALSSQKLRRYTPAYWSAFEHIKHLSGLPQKSRVYRQGSDVSTKIYKTFTAAAQSSYAHWARAGSLFSIAIRNAATAVRPSCNAVDHCEHHLPSRLPHESDAIGRCADTSCKSASWTARHSCGIGVALCARLSHASTARRITRRQGELRSDSLGRSWW